MQDLISDQPPYPTSLSVRGAVHARLNDGVPAAARWVPAGFSWAPIYRSGSDAIAQIHDLLEAGVIRHAALIQETTDSEVLHALLDELPTYVRTIRSNPDEAPLWVEMQLAQVGSEPSTLILAAK